MCGCGCDNCSGLADLARVYGLGAIPAVQYPLDQPYIGPPVTPSRDELPPAPLPDRAPDMPAGSTPAPSFALDIPGAATGQQASGSGIQGMLERIPWTTLLLIGGGIYLASQFSGKGKHR